MPFYGSVLRGSGGSVRMSHHVVATRGGCRLSGLLSVDSTEFQYQNREVLSGPVLVLV